MPEILFIQGGGGQGAHDEWDDQLVDFFILKQKTAYEIRYPRMPDEDTPNYAKWARAIRSEIAGLGDGAVVIGHSIGGTMLAQALAERAPEVKLGAIVLISAPFVGDGGWPGDEFELASDLGAKLPAGVPVHIFHGSEDATAPPAHAELYARTIAQAEVHRLRGR